MSCASPRRRAFSRSRLTKATSLAVCTLRKAGSIAVCARVPRPSTAKPTGGKASTLAVRARQPLVANCFVIQVAQALDILEHLVHRLHDGVDVSPWAEEDL